MQDSYKAIKTNLKSGIFFSFLSAAAYGINPVFAKIGYAEGLTGIEILHARLIFAVLALLAIGPVIESKFFNFSKALIKSSLWISLLVMVPLNLLYVYALKDIPASLMSLITYIYPLIILIINTLFFGFKIDLRQLCSVFLIILSCLCIFSDALYQHVSAFGLILAFGTTIVYAIYLVSIQQVIGKYSAIQLTFLTLLFSAIGLSFIHNPITLIQYSTDQLLTTFLYGLISTVFSTLFVTKAIKTIGATQASIFCSFEPVFTIGFAAILLREQIPLIRIVGMSFLVMAILLPNAFTLKQAFQKRTGK